MADKEAGERVGFSTRIEGMDDDLENYVDNGAQANEQIGIALQLTNWGRAEWERGSGDGGSDTWRAVLDQAKELQRSEQRVTSFDDDAVGYVAAICIRDHWDEMAMDDRQWCLNTVIAEIEHESDSDDYMVHVSIHAGNADRPAAYVLPKVLALVPGDAVVLAAVAKAITHTSEQAALWCAEGVGHYLAPVHQDLMMRCAGAFAMQVNLVVEQEQRERAAWMAQVSRPEQAVEHSLTTADMVREAFLNRTIDAEAAVAALDLGPWAARSVVPHISSILAGVPESAAAREFHLNAANAVVDSWVAHFEDPNLERHYESEHMIMKWVSGFVLTLPTDAALLCCQPFLVLQSLLSG